MKRFLLLAFLLAACDVRGKAELEDEAAAFAKKLRVPVRAVDCVTIDSDYDGYVSCTIFPEDGEPLSIVCARALNQEGCKIKERPAMRNPLGALDDW